VSVLVGDCRVLMAAMDPESVDAIVTDPPYELGFMGKKWDASGVAFNPEVWSQALRVLKPGGHLLAFGGTRTYHRMTCAIEDAGFHIRDTLAWIFGTGFPKNLNLGNGFGTALKPAHEPVVLARKPPIGTIAANVLAHGTGGLNIEACRLPGGKRVPSSPARDRVGQIAKGDERARTMDTSGFDPTVGRWPANVLLDEAAAALLDRQSGELGCGVAGGVPGFQSEYVNGEPKGKGGSRNGPATYGDSGGASRFFYVSKPSRAERDVGCDDLDASTAGEATDREDGSEGLNSPRAGAGRTGGRGGVRNVHPT